MSDTSMALGGNLSSMSPDLDLASVQFRAFYAELTKARGIALKSSEADADAVAKTLSKQLVQLIELQTLEARRLGGKAGVDTEVHARFLKAALADEVMLNLDWAGRKAWRHELIETTLFRSSLAGDKVFDEIDQLLSAREPSQRGIARLCLYALSLGFQGRFRGEEGTEKIADYRRELFQFIYQRPPEMEGRDRVLTPQAYTSTLSHLAARRMPRLNRWGVLFLLALLVLLGISELLWLWQSWPVRELIDPTVAALSDVYLVAMGTAPAEGLLC